MYEDEVRLMSNPEMAEEVEVRVFEKQHVTACSARSCIKASILNLHALAY